jgi:hypothetical protein
MTNPTRVVERKARVIVRASSLVRATPFDSVQPQSDVLNGANMSDPVEPLILDLLEWVGREARPYSEVIDAWRTSCPRLPVWEEANARGFVERRHQTGAEALIRVSSSGMAFLRAHRATAVAG